MRKTITIDEKNVVLQTNGIVPLIYKKEFKRDFFADVFALLEKSVDIEVVYNLIWTFAKVADENIPDLWEWAAQFESFPAIECVPIASEMVTACIKSSKPDEKGKKNASKKKKTNS